MREPVKEGLDFDDVSLIPSESEILPEEVDLTTNITKEIKLKIPIMSAGMDNVMESRLAIALSRLGGIGIIHKDMSIDNQALEVDKVKRSEHGVITDPFYLSPNHYVYEALELMEKYHISGVPVTENGKLVGIITNRDLRFEYNGEKKIYEVMTKDNLVKAPEGTTLDDAQKILLKHKIEKLPIIDGKGILKGLITIKDIDKMIKYPNAARDSHGRLLVGAAVGFSEDMLERIGALIKAKVDLVLVDTLHAHYKGMIRQIKKVKETYPDLQLIVGNIATGEGTKAFADIGVDGIKVGFDSKRMAMITGVGMPRITALNDCYEASNPYGVPVISDGGVRFSGDIVKAIAGGAAACMIGGVFEERFKRQGRPDLRTARRLCNADEKIIDYKGYVKDTVEQFVEGLTIGMSCCGAATINELQKKGRFIRIK